MTQGVAVAPIRVVAREFAPCTAFISSNARTIEASGFTTRRIEGFLLICDLGLWESMSAERDVYEGMYRSRKYRGGPTPNGIGHTRDCSGIFNSFSLLITGLPTSS